ncbi:hypothetical protein [Hyalangium rubrum]|uniref:Lipoprotein n=1 Tax=Hyalangium rubrum TaxID=3103134 RepID=A0ABU5HJD8_9BACT|nr:hypothetical protein [Hyalangium sp. s54d21]MDY7232210.1 hypothetical protein [Hyalangium sp. s54d21]
MRFHAGWLSAGIAALLLTAGCKEGRSIQGSEQASASDRVEQAQKQSEKAFDQAENAQQEASDQQREAARAQQVVEETRTELAEAESRAQKELQEAQASQQQAQTAQQQAQQTVTEAQASALEAQRQQESELAQQDALDAQQSPQAAEQASEPAQQPMAQAPLPSTPSQGEQLIIGEVLTASEREVMVSVRGEPQLRLQVGPSTQIIVDGQQGRAADIQEGSQVRASYRDTQGEPTAVRIEVTSSMPPAMPVSPESGESQPGAQPPQPLNP